MDDLLHATMRSMTNSDTPAVAETRPHLEQGRKVRAAREAKNLSQLEVAEAASVHQTTVAVIENAARPYPEATVQRVMRAIDELPARPKLEGSPRKLHGVMTATRALFRSQADVDLVLAKLTTTERGDLLTRAARRKLGQP